MNFGACIGLQEIMFKVQWMGGEKSWVRMDDLRTHDPFLVARYGLREKLDGKPGWEWIKEYMDSDNKMESMINAYKLSTETTYKFGVQVPQNTKDSLQLDKESGNDLWSKAIDTKFTQINGYEALRVLEDDELMPPGYKRIPYHCIYDVKFDGRRKCRLVAGGTPHRPSKRGHIFWSGIDGSRQTGFHPGKNE